MKKLKRNLIVTGFLTLVPLASAISKPATGQPGGNETAKSIIVDIQHDAGDVRSIVTEQFIPTINELKRSLKEHHAEARQRFEQYQKTKSDTDAVAYEESIAAAITDVEIHLSDIVDMQGSVDGVLDDLDASLGNGIQEFTNQRDVWTDRATEYGGQIKEIEQVLDSLTTKLDSYLQSGKPLPIEIDTMICNLGLNLKILQSRQQTAINAETMIGNWLGRCSDFNEMLSRVRAEYSLVFASARGQIVLIGEVAEHRRDALNARAIVRELDQLAGELEAAQAGFADISTTLNDISIMPIDGEAQFQNGDWHGVGQGRALEILNSWKKEKKL